MKNPLMYQSTEYDCGPTSMINAINYLYNRKDIYPEVIRNIMLYSLDSYNRNGEAHKSGTTGMAMIFISSWLNQFGKVKKWPIYSEAINGEKVQVGQHTKIAEAIGQGGVVVAKVMLGWWHYVLITGIDKEYVYLFDPYYREKSFNTEGLEIITNAPKKMNRKVKHEIMNSEGKENYALGKIDSREMVILFNSKTRICMDSIEYMI